MQTDLTLGTYCTHLVDEDTEACEKEAPRSSWRWIENPSMLLLTCLLSPHQAWWGVEVGIRDAKDMQVDPPEGWKVGMGEGGASPKPACV